MNKNKILIKRATAKDFHLLPDIETATAKLFKEFISDCVNLPPSPESYYHSLSEKSAVFIAYTDDNSVVGFIVVTTLDNQGHIAEVDVLPEYTRKGIGKNLINQAILWAKSNNYEWLTLTTFKNIPFNAPFYRKLGFIEFIPSENQPEIRETIKHEQQILGEILKNHPRIAMRINVNSWEI
ncbi:MAG: GNAT family N-acetyltransferase [Alphaproteobacteria bacterium]